MEKASQAGYHVTHYDSSNIVFPDPGFQTTGIDFREGAMCFHRVLCVFFKCIYRNTVVDRCIQSNQFFSDTFLLTLFFVKDKKRQISVVEEGTDELHGVSNYCILNEIKELTDLATTTEFSYLSIIMIYH